MKLASKEFILICVCALIVGIVIGAVKAGYDNSHKQNMSYLGGPPKEKVDVSDDAYCDYGWTVYHEVRLGCECRIRGCPEKNKNG